MQVTFTDPYDYSSVLVLRVLIFSIKTGSGSRSRPIRKEFVKAMISIRAVSVGMRP